MESGNPSPSLTHFPRRVLARASKPLTLFGASSGRFLHGAHWGFLHFCGVLIFPVNQLVAAVLELEGESVSFCGVCSFWTFLQKDYSCLVLRLMLLHF